MRKKKGRNIIW